MAVYFDHVAAARIFPFFIGKKMSLGIWPWTEGIRSRFPEHYKKHYMEKYQKEPQPVHWQPNPNEYYLDEFGEKQKTVNAPIPVIYTDFNNRSLLGGEGFIECFMRKKKRSWPPLPNWMTPNSFAEQTSELTGKRLDILLNCEPKLFLPDFHSACEYSEILNQWLTFTCTLRTRLLIDQHYGFDNYILKTHEVDLRSLLGMRLKRLMLLALATEAPYPEDPARHKELMDKYKEFIIPVEEADWIGLNIKEAETKQFYLEMNEREKVKPLKDIFYLQLCRRIKEGGLDVQKETWASKLSPFKKQESKEDG